MKQLLEAAAGDTAGSAGLLCCSGRGALPLLQLHQPTPAQLLTPTHHHRLHKGPGILWHCSLRWTWTGSTVSWTWKWRLWDARRSGRSHKWSRSWKKLSKQTHNRQFCDNASHWWAVGKWAELPRRKCLLLLGKLLKMWQAISGWQAINEGLLGEGIFSFFLRKQSTVWRTCLC